MDHLQGILDELLKRKLKQALQGIEEKKALRNKTQESLGHNEQLYDDGDEYGEADESGEGDRNKKNRHGNMSSVQTPRRTVRKKSTIE